MRAIYVDKAIPRMLLVKMLRPVWPAVVWSPISPVRVADLEEPVLPGPRWLRVKNRQCGVCASDLSLLRVEVDPAIAPAALPGNVRFYLGHEVVGEVTEVGSGVERFRVGDRVVMESRFTGPTCHTMEIDPPCVFCAHGQARLCENSSLSGAPVGVGGGWGDGFTAHEAELWPVPDDLDDDQATLIEPMSVAVHGVLRAPPQPGWHALVIGAGSIGLLTAHAVRVIEPEAHVTVVARHPHQAEAAKRLGVDEVISGGDLYSEMARITGGKFYTSLMNRGMLLGGFEAIYDCVGSRDTLVDALRWARAGGTVVLVGTTLSSLRVDLNPIWYQEVDLKGSLTFGVEEWRGGQVHTFDLVIDLMREGILRREGLITHRFPFEDHRKAVATAIDKSTGSIKVSFVYS